MTWLKGKSVLVTGAAGTVGRAVGAMLTALREHGDGPGQHAHAKPWAWHPKRVHTFASLTQLLTTGPNSHDLAEG
jgi:hypothetical protein